MNPQLQKWLVLATVPLFLLAALFLSRGEAERRVQFFQRLPLMGRAEAPVEIVLFEDPLCPKCRALHREILPEIEKRYLVTGKAHLRLALVPFLPGADPFCLGFFCLAQEKPEALMPYLDALCERAPTQVSALLDRLGLNSEKMEQCLTATESKRSLQQIEHATDRLLGEDSSVPAAFVNGQRVPLPIDKYLLEAVRHAVR